jgi:hypothetical protein
VAPSYPGCRTQSLRPSAFHFFNRLNVMLVIAVENFELARLVKCS